MKISILLRLIMIGLGLFFIVQGLVVVLNYISLVIDITAGDSNFSYFIMPVLYILIGLCLIVFHNLITDLLPINARLLNYDLAIHKLDAHKIIFIFLIVLGLNMILNAVPNLIYVLIHKFKTIVSANNTIEVDLNYDQIYYNQFNIYYDALILILGILLVIGSNKLAYFLKPI